MSSSGTNGGHLVRMRTLAPTVAIAVLALVGCSASDESTTRQPGTQDGPVLAAGAAQEVTVMQALMRRTVVRDAGTDCLVLEEGAGGMRSPILWPSGASWSPESSSVVVPGGSAVAVGSSVELGGGYVGIERVEFLAGRDVRVALERCGGGDIAVLQSGFGAPA